ncbi:MAG: hypothetical protein LBV33_03630 [Lachnospiraceae bacterium]|nr:hypothetical protein [Lachnospiraceae bacterium]
MSEWQEYDDYSSDENADAGVTAVESRSSRLVKQVIIGVAMVVAGVLSIVVYGAFFATYPINNGDRLFMLLWVTPLVGGGLVGLSSAVGRRIKSTK